MKRAILLLLTVLSLNTRSQCAFTLTPSGTLQLTCINTVVATTASPGTQSYTWISVSDPPQNGSSASFTAPGVYTCATSVGTCAAQQTFAVVHNTVGPSTTVAPLSQAIDCNTQTAVTFSGMCSNPTVNLQHDWYSPINPLPGGPPIATSNNTLTILSGNVPPGVYTLQTTNLVTGCKTQKTVTVTSLSAYPTFSMSSPTNFSLGCPPLNQTTLTIVGAQSTQTPPATCSFTFLPPGFSGTLGPGPFSGSNNSTVTALPGTWTIVVNDNSNGCKSFLSIPVLVNTVGPHVVASMATQTLLCKTPTVLATGSSTTQATTVQWNVPISPPLVTQPTLVIGIPANGPATSTTALTYANYTVVATNSLNACQTTSVVVISQNFRKPIVTPTISISTPTAIYCNAATKPAVLTTGSSTTTSGGGPTAFVANPCWSGPAPQTPTCGPATYNCFVPGVYSLTLEDNYNGCLGSGTVNVLDRTQPPVVTNPNTVAILDCGGASASATLVFALTGTMTGGVRFLVDSFPLNAAFNPTAATIFNVNPDLSGTTASVVTVDKIGYYGWIVTNTLTGCTATGVINVTQGGLTAAMEASPPTGFAPLSVNFFNNSTSSLGSGSISSIWNFGNGAVATTTTTAGQQSTTYNTPGTYTVTLIAVKGTGCIDTAYTVIKVDIPSKMEVPNVFTPNGDGTNDVFFLKVANLTEITALIFDRWGQKVYETKSVTGNIAWDGKNQAGKECPAGTYFYVISGKGKDDKAYESKGNLSLFR